MPKIRIKRCRGEGISISGPATIHVSRRVMLVVRAPREARIDRLAKQPPRAPENRSKRTADDA